MWQFKYQSVKLDIICSYHRQNADFGIKWCFEYLLAIELSLSWQHLSEMAMYQSGTSAFACIYMSIIWSIYLPIYLSIYLSSDLSTYLSGYLSLYLSIYLSIFRSIYLIFQGLNLFSFVSNQQKVLWSDRKAPARRSLLRPARKNPPPTNTKPRERGNRGGRPWQWGEQLRLLAKLKSRNPQAYTHATERFLIAANDLKKNKKKK